MKSLTALAERWRAEAPAPPPIEPATDHDAGETEGMAWSNTRPGKHVFDSAGVETVPASAQTEEVFGTARKTPRLGLLSGEADLGVCATVAQTSSEEVAPYYLRRDAERVRLILAAGGTAAWCPSGALDMTCRDGRLVLYSPSNARRLLEEGKLPAEVARNARHRGW